VSYNIFQLVLDFQQNPSHFEALIGPGKPLPEDTGKLLEEVAGKISSDSDDDSPTDELFSATAFFIERVLFMPGGDLYRQLGLEQYATQEQIRKHYHLLMHLFFLDREDMAADWSAEYADCINRAYSILRDPVKRRNYDDRLTGKKSVVGSQTTYSESNKSFAHSIVSFTEARNQKQVGKKAEDEAASEINEQLSRRFVAGVASAPSENITIHPDVARVAEEDSYIAESIERAYSDIGARASPVNDEQVPYPDAKEFTSTEFNQDAHDRIAPAWDGETNQTVESAYLKRSQGKSSSKTAIILVSFVVIVGIMAAVYQYQISPTDSVINNIEKTKLQVQPASESDNVIAGSVEREAMPEMVEESAALSFEAPVAPVPVQDDQPEVAMDFGVGGSQPQVTTFSSGTTGSAPDVTSPVITGLSLSPRRILPPKVEPSAMSAPVQMPDMMQKKVKTLISKPAKPAEKKVKSKNVVIAKSSAAPASQAKAPIPRNTDVFPPPKMASPTVKTPSPGTDVGVVSSLSPFPEPAPKSVPKTLKPTIRPIPQGDLDKMIRTFVRSYEEGNLKTLLSVFAGNARTNDRTNRNGIAEDYRDLFGVAEKRQFIFDDLKWDRTVENHAKGKGAFEVKILLKGESTVTTIVGQVTIDVERRGKELLITRFFHTYQ